MGSDSWKWLVTEWKVPLLHNTDMNVTNLLRNKHGHEKSSSHGVRQRQVQQRHT